MILAALIACAQGTSSDHKATSPLPTAMPAEEVAVAIEPGTYRISRSAWSVSDFTITIPEGWEVQYGHVYLKHENSPEEISFYPVLVDAIYADACTQEGEVLVDVGPRVEHLTNALLDQPGPATSGPVETTFAGRPATRVDLGIPKGLDLEACRVGGAGLQVWYSPPADKYFILLPGAEASVYVFEVDGRRQVFMTQSGPETSDEDLQELRTILDSIQIVR